MLGSGVERPKQDGSHATPSLQERMFEAHADGGDPPLRG